MQGTRTSVSELEVSNGRKEGRKEIVFNDALNTFYLWLYGIRHVVKDHWLKREIVQMGSIQRLRLVMEFFFIFCCCSAVGKLLILIQYVTIRPANCISVQYSPKGIVTKLVFTLRVLSIGGLPLHITACKRTATQVCVCVCVCVCVNQHKTVLNGI